MKAHPRNNTTNRFPRFKEALNGNFKDKVILDFGGSRGNLLYFSNGEIQPENYISIDPVMEGIEMGREEFPAAEFIYYDRWSWMYNHHGNKEINLPDITRKIDYIVAYSVFSHTDFNELVTTLKWMKSLNPEKMVISFLDANSKHIKDYFEDRRFRSYGSTLEMPLNKYNVYYYLDNDQIIADQKECPMIPCKHFIALYNIPWLIDELNNEGIQIQAPAYFSKSTIPFMIIE